MINNSSLAAIIAVVGAFVIIAVNCYSHSRTVAEVYAGALETNNLDARVDTLVDDALCWSRKGQYEAQCWAIGIAAVTLAVGFIMSRRR